MHPSTFKVPLYYAGKARNELLFRTICNQWWHIKPEKRWLTCGYDRLGVLNLLWEVDVSVIFALFAFKMRLPTKVINGVKAATRKIHKENASTF